MKIQIVDASVAAKWFFPEQHSDRALRLLSDRWALMAPDLLVSEFGSIVWKHCRRGDITPVEAEAILRDFLSIPVQLVASRGLVASALGVALETGCTVYDSLYLALAINNNTRLISADERFFNAMRIGPYAAHIRWIGGRL